MRKNTEDKTLERNYLQKFRHLIKEYELVKSGKHPKYRFVTDFYKANDTSRQTFLKYYNRFKLSGSELDLLPKRRGARYKTRQIVGFIEQKIIKLRGTGQNKYEIVNTLRPQLKHKTPSPSGVYNVLKRNGINRLRPKMQEERRRIIKEKAGELGHVDAHYLAKGIVRSDNKRYYVVAVIDSCTRVCWAEIVEDIKSLTVMFAILRCINMLSGEYNIKFEEMLTDNGSEFGNKNSKSKENHPFERMLIEIGIKHRYIRPYRPQTNGKIERFWRTIEEDLFAETDFDSLHELRDELMQYLVYYNEERPHQSLGGLAPNKFNQNCQRTNGQRS